MPPISQTCQGSQYSRPRLTVEERLSEYKQGSIRRVRLQNFLTYADVEFTPGPRLNVVIGPNGTGKSTILCAICLGLGGQPTLLGRADDARTFIMHEKDRALIEVELSPKNATDEADVIRRVIDRNKGSEKGRGLGASTFYINGEKSNLKSVKKLVEKYHIAVDNLCTFLPQDRVGSFSGFTPIDLLKETEKAIGMETMYEPHMELQRLEDEVNNESNEKESIKERLNSLKEENARLEREKELMEERKHAETKLGLLQKKKIWLLFDRAREQAVVKKEERDNLKIELLQARRSLEPLEKKTAKMKTEVEKIKAESKTYEKSSKRVLAEYNSAISKYDSYQDRIDDEASILTSIDSQRRQQLRDVEKLKQRGESLEEALHRDFPPMEDILKNEKEAHMELKEAKKKRDQVKRELRNIEMTYNDLEAEIQTDFNKLEKMKDEKKRRQERLFRQQPQLGEAFHWVNQNRKMFRRPVWGPVAGELSIKSENAASYLEQHVSYSILKSFIVECKEDYNLLYRELREKRDIPVNINVVNNGKLNEIHRLYSDEKMRILKHEHGVMGYLDESFDAPDAVLQALITGSSVHAVLVGGEKTQESIDKRGLIDYLSEKENGSSEKMNACIFSRIGNKAYKYTSMVSRYSGKSFMRQDEINRARMLAPGTAPELKERLERELHSKRQKLDNYRPQRLAAQDNFEKIMTAAQALSTRVKDVDRAKKNVIAQRNKIAENERKYRESKARAQRDHGGEKRNIIDKLRQLIDLSLTELEHVGQSQKAILETTLALAGVKMTEDGIAASEQRIRDILEEKLQETQNLQNRLMRSNAEFNDLKKKMKDLKNKADQVAPMKDAEGNDLPLKAKLQDLPETLSEIEATIADTQDIINNITDNPEVLRQYEERKKEIVRIQEDFENVENAQSAKKAKLISLLSDWSSRLKNTVQRVNALFSTYMTDLGCAGEIKLDTGNSEKENSNFSKWGIEIRVKFREKSSLQVLSAQVQSGGERSVSTIMYLMALQELMKSPFRCVDEINQGLDERNERLVFRRIVKNSTKMPQGEKSNHCGQYFLITPKLLPNLTDMENENVTVLFIFNGPFNFNHFSDWKCDKFIGFKNNSSDDSGKKHSFNDHEDNDSINIKKEQGTRRIKRRISED